MHTLPSHDHAVLRLVRIACVAIGLPLWGCATQPTAAPEAAPVQAAVAPPATPLPPASATPPAPTDDSIATRFRAWVDKFARSASAAGVPAQTLDTAFREVQHLPRVIEMDRFQPEFTRPLWDYLDSAVSPQRIARGREKIDLWRAQLEPVVAKYGVPLEVLVAIWGVESNFGTHVGDLPAIDALATLGFDGRREAWAKEQLMAALKILQSGEIDRAQMIGSWAGAMGQTQFLPTVFLAYAVDADGDGRRDIWGSTPDVMASTAHFLSRSGWQAGQVWGAEVKLPAGFDYGRVTPNIQQSSAAWAQEGVKPVGPSAELPDIPAASLLLPAGASGPAFLVGANFRTVLKYNNSNSYALAVSLLAQRLAGGPPVRAAWPKHLQPLSKSQLMELQQALNARGFDCGVADGVMGPATQRGIRAYQRSRGWPADAYPTLELLRSLQP